MSISFEGKVAIVTGAGNGLGRSHALALAERGAKVVVNDLGGARDGTGASSDAAMEVVGIIEAAGGEAFAHGANVSKFDEVEDMVAQAMAKWGRVDILINNAGILRDKSFSKMDLADFKLVMDVHLMGSVNCTKAVWDIMREQNYGRIVMTTSSSGMYGNFGQSNYGAAKMAVLGFMNTLVLEGGKNNIHVNALAPTAGTRMTEDLMPPEMLGLLTAESVTAAALVLCDETAPTRTILCAGAGGYAKSGMYETDGIFLPQAEQNPEAIVAQWDELSDVSNHQPLESGSKQTEKFLMKAMAALKA
ncbi:oxidoreductase, short chain dehydrogenase/reductase family protein [gamma proteobacterium HTCC2207]|jgi:NAD(P)-dependent dehydrogenase (short-subunit alcohol dehydrogenase family)|uniref:Oxidoreductase, short chain dehydrogenase/reductase family protein n=1 Tax=gamma proteobacterium HTCC2207 TaxID=314287 RepID=Q1YTY9_9GAMM|nr:oxidoreductase, short chain dehydrogenase/reductase family protein [gamma proteobacterium HTCC2207]MBT5106820.1 SDR family NAD(P)-dependent oxidoreductase [Porticoccaceae bacterium]MDC3261052.1 SDR family NAD(P)-dependent oxidoreductase [bacterium]MBT6116051.1 SDR family NAD(P)-dependent oxidoreductase [Porticoccaceae bacterium]MBT6592976.1 SDR family NAD(P)-dependent oxidoreductase [Porticoccaceae bacterium]